MSRAIGFISREHTTSGALPVLAPLPLLALCLALPVCALAQFDPSRPFLSAAGKQTLKAGAPVTRWFEIELKNSTPQPHLTELLVFQCNGIDAQASGPRTLQPGQTLTVSLSTEAPCAAQLRAALAKTERPAAAIFLVAALLQPALPGLELSVRAQYLQGENIHLHANAGVDQPPPRREIRTFIRFNSALLLNPSNGQATVRTCANPGRDWPRLADCRSNLTIVKLAPGGAILVTDPGPISTLDFQTASKPGFVHALVFESSAGEKKHYEVDSTITFTEPK